MTMPNITDIIDYESGEMDEERAVDFFQGMINSGIVWQLQGAYGRTAHMLIENGMCLTASEFAAGERVANEEVAAI